MKVHQRLFLVLVALLGVFLGAYYWDVQRQEAESRDLFDALLQSEYAQLKAVLDVDGRRLMSYAEDYSWSDAMAAYVSAPSPQWWAEQMVGSPQLYGATRAWALDVNLDPVGVVDEAGVVQQADAPFFLPQLRQALSRAVGGHFFAMDGDVLWELRYAPVQPASDLQRKGAPRGCFVAGRRWDAKLLARLSLATGAQFTLVDPGTLANIEPLAGDLHAGRLKFAVPLRGEDGLPVAGLRATASSPLLQLTNRQLDLGRRWTVIGLGGAGALFILLCIQSVTRPLRRISLALERNDMSLLRKLSRAGTEMGLIARLVETGFEQRQSLETEIRRRADAELKLAQREHFLSSILRHLNGVVLVISRDGILNLAEGRELEAYGLRKERDEGRQIGRILRGQERLVHFEQALNGRRVVEEQSVGERVFLTTCEPLPGKDGKVDLVVALALDITDKKQAEAALLRAKQEAERADKLKSQFLSVMSHETRTPLNGVLGFAGVLRDTDLDEDQLAYLDKIVESGKNLLRLLTDILDLTRLEAGETERSMDEISLTALVFQMAERYRLAAENKGLKFEVDISPELPESLITDQEKVIRIMEGIFDNALKFTERGYIKLVVMRMRDPEERPEIVLTVADTGPGISNDIARFIFDPFQQGDSSRTRRHGGLGLGLTIAHRLARQIDGRLTFESEMGKGSRFSLHLPLNEPEPQPPPDPVRQAIERDLGE